MKKILLILAMAFIISNVNAAYTLIDDFNGTNGDPWDASIWEVGIDSGGIAQVLIQSNQGEFAKQGCNGCPLSYYAISDACDIADVNSFCGIEIENISISSPTTAQRESFGFYNPVDIAAGSLHNGLIYCMYGDKDPQAVESDDAPLWTGTTHGVTCRLEIRRLTPSIVQVNAFVDGTKRVTDFNVTNSDTNLFATLVKLHVDAVGDSNSVYDNFKTNFNPVDINGIFASISADPVSAIIDASIGRTTVTTDFNSTSDLNGIIDINYTWFIEDIQLQQGADTNFTWIFTDAVGDFNVSLLAVGHDGNKTFTSQADLNYLVRNAPASYDITLDTFNSFNNDVNVSFGVTPAFDPLLNSYFQWGGTDFDINILGSTIDKNYNTGGNKQVCLIVNLVGDINKFVCEDFTSTRFLVRIPEDEDTLTDLTPFGISTTIPQQTYSTQSTDINVFNFFQTSAEFTITADFNSDYYDRSYLYNLTSTDYFFELQPYLDSVADSAQVTITVIDGLTNNPLADYIIELYIFISNVETLAESKTTDGAGVAIFSMLLGEDYVAKIYDSSQVFIDQKTIDPSNTSYIWKINVETPDINVSEVALTVDFQPQDTTVTFLPTDDTNKTFFQIIDSNATQTSSNINITVGSTEIYDQNFTADGNRSQDFNFSAFDDKSIMTVTVTITNAVKSQSFTKIYVIRNTSDFDFMLAMRNAKTDLTDFGAMILSLLLALVVAGFVSYFVGFDTTVLGLVLMLILGFFVLATWYPVLIYLLGLLGYIASIFVRGRIK